VPICARVFTVVCAKIGLPLFESENIRPVQPAGRSAGRFATSVISACTPPAEAPITIVSRVAIVSPRLGSLVKDTTGELYPERVVRLFERRAREAEEHGSVIRQLLLSGQKADIGEATVGND